MVKDMKNEEKDKPEVKANSSASLLNETAEYQGSKKDEEDILLTAQRYLNIFHQIHIFNDRKKNEFDQYLLDMPQNVRQILVVLPGGRILLRHIKDLQDARGIRDADLLYLLEQVPDHFSDITKAAALSPQQTMANLTDTINNALNTYNENMQKLGEEMQKNSLPQNLKTLVDAMQDSNQKQIEMMKDFGQSISNAIIQSQKNIVSAADKASAEEPHKLAKVVRKADLEQTKQDIPAVKLRKDSTFVLPTEKKSQLNTQNARNSAISDHEAMVDIDINDILSEQIQSQNTAKSAKKTAPIQTVNSDKKLSDIYDSAMEKIKTALNTPAPAQTSAAPVSLEKDDLSISDSFYKNNNKKSTDTTAKNNDDTGDDEWVYVDEYGNPVDKDGNPIDGDWEYVDEDGNPIDDGDWEYVDEDGNPVN